MSNSGRKDNHFYFTAVCSASNKSIIGKTKSRNSKNEIAKSRIEGWKNEIGFFAHAQHLSRWPQIVKKRAQTLIGCARFAS
jgi:hypothetical protein